MKLANNNEIIGKLESVKDCQDFISLIFKTEIEVKIPKNAIPFDLLQRLVKMRIGIININGQYRIRNLEGGSTGNIYSEAEYNKTIEKIEEIFKIKDKETSQKEK